MAAEQPTWQELHGSKRWVGLLDPLHIDLRHFIVHCGTFVQATYDAFNSDPRSKYCGSSRYGKANFFHKLDLEETAEGYDVVAFLYATSSSDLPAFVVQSLSTEAWDKESNWIGYIAVSNDVTSKKQGRREIYVVWRGTIRNMEWMTDLKAQLHPIDLLLADKHNKKGPHLLDPLYLLGGKPMIERGWFTIYTESSSRSVFCKRSARDQLHAKLKEVVNLYKDEVISVVCAGHSLGASLATVSAFDIAENRLAGDALVTAIAFESPQIGNIGFKEYAEKMDNFRVLRVRNEMDPVPLLPGYILGFQDTGVELLVDTRVSNFLKNSVNPSDLHNLEAALHMVCGWMGRYKAFELQVPRSIALVNKSCDFLKDDLLVPPLWWSERHKGMVKGDDKVWRLAPPGEGDIPVPEFENL